MVFDANDSSRQSGYCISHGFCNAWVTMDNYVNGSINGEVTADSDIKEYLNGDYEDSLSSVSNYIAANMTWNIGSSGTQTDTNTIAQLKSLESAYTWTGDIALLTKSEYMNANTNSLCLTASSLDENKDACKDSNYLYKNYWYWSLSPYTSDSFHVLLAGSIGYVYSYANNTYGIRPVLYLKSNVILEGNGTNGNGAYRITGLEQ